MGNPDLTVDQHGCHEWTSPYPVRLLFYVNDDNITDNGGSWDYEIYQYWN